MNNVRVPLLVGNKKTTRRKPTRLLSIKPSSGVRSRPVPRKSSVVVPSVKQTSATQLTPEKKHHEEPTQENNTIEKTQVKKPSALFSFLGRSADSTSSTKKTDLGDEASHSTPLTSVKNKGITKPVENVTVEPPFSNTAPVESIPPPLETSPPLKESVKGNKKKVSTSPNLQKNRKRTRSMTTKKKPRSTLRVDAFDFNDENSSDSPVRKKKQKKSGKATNISDSDSDYNEVSAAESEKETAIVVRGKRRSKAIKISESRNKRPKYQKLLAPEQASQMTMKELALSVPRGDVHKYRKLRASFLTERSFRDKEEEMNSMRLSQESDEKSIYTAPSVEIINGELVLKNQEASTSSPQKPQELETTEKGSDENLAHPSMALSLAYSNRRSMKKWTNKETLFFYECLYKVGTDFTMMACLFSTRNRNELKIKFKTEERVHPKLIETTLEAFGTMNDSTVDEILENLDDRKKE